MGSVRVAIVGVGNCASSLVQGVEYYKDADSGSRVPGLMHVQFGPYHVRDVEFVAAFDVDAKKVGRDIAEAIVASENNTIKICDVPPTGVTVQRGPTLDGLGEYYLQVIDESDERPVDVVGVKRAADATLLPVGAEHEVVDDELAPALEEILERLLPVGTLEDIGLLDLHPGQSAALPAQFVLEPGEMLLLLQEFLAGDDPFFARDDGVIDHVTLR